MTDDEAMVHIEVSFGDFPDIRLDFKALESAARAFADAARHIARVHIDDILTDTLKPLPCAVLWI